MVILQEIAGARTAQVVLQDWEAQTISVLLNQKSQEPYKTAWLLSYMLENLNIRILKVEIQKRFRGDMEAKISYFSDNATHSISHSPGEAIELAIRCRAPILIQRSFLMPSERHSDAQQSVWEKRHLKRLRGKLKKAIEVEQYEQAAKLRDKILNLEKRLGIKSDEV